MDEKPIFDRKWFNREYFVWMSNLYEKNPELAKEMDYKVISSLGCKMAKEIKETLPESKNKIEYLFSALEKSHWFQENVELISKNENEMTMQVKNCTWQLPWIKKFGKPYDYCAVSHEAWLKEFAKEIEPKIKIENLRSPSNEPPADGVYCKWKFRI